MKRLVGLLLVLALPSAHSEQLQIDVVGLFKDAVILNISGKQILLKAGARSPEGVLLVSADSREAVIEYSGERQRVNLSSRINTSFTERTEASVSIMLNQIGQYRTTGNINGRPVSFLVDTGATVIAINSEMARDIGIDSSKGKITRATTASGVVESRMVTLELVQVGDIQVRNVQAAVIPGSYPEEILLGMSFLHYVEIQESSGVMQLSTKF